MSNSANIFINISEELLVSIEVMCSRYHMSKESVIEEAIRFYICKGMGNQKYSVAQIIEGYLEMGAINIKLAQEY